MQADPLLNILTLVQQGNLSPDQALGLVQAQMPPATVADIGFAHVDLDRKTRCGFPEVIFCEGKTPIWVEGVARKLIEANQDCFGTRLNPEQAEHIQKVFPNAEIDRVGRTFWLAVSKDRPTPVGYVPVFTAGTGDLPVAYEALNTLKVLGVNAEIIADVGVAGLHRLLKYRENIQRADCILVIAGMDGALPSVVGGLSDCPIFAVPTSIGYGTTFGGVAPLLTMLNACSANVVVVNIDAGFKAGYTAGLLTKRTYQKQTPPTEK